MSPDEAIQAIEARTAQKIRTTRILYCFALLGIASVGFLEYQTREALCTFTGNLSRSVAQTDSYLNDRDKHGRLVHPGPILGVPRATMLQNLKNQKRAAKSLRGLHC